MAQADFVTLADSLIAVAEAAEHHFRSLGYTVRREPAVVGYPYTPTLRCTRSRTTLILEVDTEVRTNRVSEWVRYGRSCSMDFRVAAVTPSSQERDTSADNAARNQGAGLYAANGGVVELHMPHDLSLNLELPDLADMPHRMRKALGPMYEQFGRSHWREGFEDGCQAFESECRRYLKKGLATNRIVVLDELARPRRLSDAQVDRMTMGQLAKAYSNFQTPNHPDTTIGDVLVKINPQRVAVAHHKVRPQTEARLRKNVGQNVWLIFAGMKALLDVH